MRVRRGLAARVSFRFFLLSRRLGLRRLASVGRIRPLGPFFAPLEAPFAGRVLLLSSALPVLQALLSQLVSLPLS